MKLQKIPIDYSKAGTGEAPFDGKGYLIHSTPEQNVNVMYWLPAYNQWVTDDCSIGEYEKHTPLLTHYTPMPQFEEVKGGEA